MLVFKLTREQRRDYTRRREEFRERAEHEARLAGETSVQLVDSSGKLVEQLHVGDAPKKRGGIRFSGGLSKAVMRQVAKSVPDPARAWREIRAAWKKDRTPLGRPVGSYLYVHDGVYYRIERGEPVRTKVTR